MKGLIKIEIEFITPVIFLNQKEFERLKVHNNVDATVKIIMETLSHDGDCPMIISDRKNIFNIKSIRAANYLNSLQGVVLSEDSDLDEDQIDSDRCIYVEIEKRDIIKE